MADRPRLDRERDAVGGGVDEPERRRQLLVVGGVGGVQRHRPVEDRLVRRDRVGDRRTGQPVAGEVLVGVDETGQDEPIGTAEPVAGRQRRCSSAAGPTSTIRPSSHGHGTVADHRARRDPSSAPTRPPPADRRPLAAPRSPRASRYGRTNRPSGRSATSARRGSSVAPVLVRRRRGWRHRSTPRTPSACSATTSSSGGDPDGTLVAAPDRCPHREAPLSPGHVVDGCLECCYHGWTFGAEGRCVRVPSAPDGVPIPPRSHLSHRPRRRALRPRVAVPRRSRRRDPARSPPSTTRRTAGSTPASMCGARRRRG